MSESSEMGLFGSKDNKEDKKESHADEQSPDRYTPYSIDGDSESYDTEALSIMDINDIIGVQSENVGDSTLESEIAALSEIIKDSKAEPGQSTTNTTSEKEEFKQTNVCDKSIMDNDKCNKLDSQKDVMSEPMSVDESVEDTEMRLKSPVLTECLTNPVDFDNKTLPDSSSSTNNSSAVADVLPAKDTLDEQKNIEVPNTKIEDELDTANKLKNNQNQCVDTDDKVNVVMTLGNIGKSLQLIGEAYTSEDSQEATENDDNLKETNLLNHPLGTLISNMINSDKQKEIEQTGNNLKVAVEQEKSKTAVVDVMPVAENVSEKSENESGSMPINTEKHSEIIESVPMPETPRKEGVKHVESVDSLQESLKIEHNVENINLDTAENNSVQNVNKEEAKENLQDETNVISLNEELKEFDKKPTEGNIDCPPEPIEKDCIEENIVKEIDEGELKEILDVKTTDPPCENDSQNSGIDKDIECSPTIPENEEVIRSQTPEKIDVEKAILEPSDSNQTIIEILQVRDDVKENLQDINSTDTQMKMHSIEDTVENNNELNSSSTINLVKEPDENQSVENSKEAIEINLPLMSEPVNKSEEFETDNTQEINLCSTQAESVLEEDKVETEKNISIEESEQPIMQIKSDVKGEEESLSSDIKEIEEIKDLDKNNEQITETCPKIVDNSNEKEEVDRAQDISNTDVNIPENIECNKNVILESHEPENTVEFNEKNLNIDNKENVEVETSEIEGLDNTEQIPETCLKRIGSPVQTELEDIKIDMKNSKELILKAYPEITKEENLEIIKKSEENVDLEVIKEPKSDENSEVIEKLEENTNSEIITNSGESIDVDIIRKPEEHIHLEISKNEEENADFEISKNREENVDFEISKNQEVIVGLEISKNQEEIVDLEISKNQKEIVDLEIIKKPEENTGLEINKNQEENVDHEISKNQEEIIDLEISKNQEEIIDPEISKNQEEIIDPEISKNQEENVDFEISEKQKEQEIPAKTILEKSNNLPEEENDGQLTILSTNLKNVTDTNEPIVQQHYDDPCKMDIDEKPSELSHDEKSDQDMPTEVSTIKKKEVTTYDEESNETVTLTLDLEESEPNDALKIFKHDKRKNEKPGKSEDTVEALNMAENEIMNVLENIPSEKDLINVPPDFSNSSENDTIEFSENKNSAEDNLKIGIEKNNVKINLETEKDTNELIFEEQSIQSSQNTQSVSIILNNEENMDKLKNILNEQTNLNNDSNNDNEVLQSSSTLSLEIETEDSTKKLPESPENTDHEKIEDFIPKQNLDLLEQFPKSILTENLETEDTVLQIQQPEEETKIANENLEILDQVIPQEENYLENLIDTRSTVTLEEKIIKPDEDLTKEIERKSTPEEELKSDITNYANVINKDENDTEVTRTQTDSPENESNLNLDVNPLESINEIEEEKLELPQNILLDQDQTEALIDASTMENSEPSSEISELESAVKFLQESEERSMDSSLILSPKMVDPVDDIPKEPDTLFTTNDICTDPSELVAELQEIVSDSISISEAEIISEAAKLENERKLAEEQIKLNAESQIETKENVLEDQILEELGVKELRKELIIEDSINKSFVDQMMQESNDASSSRKEVENELLVTKPFEDQIPKELIETRDVSINKPLENQIPCESLIRCANQFETPIDMPKITERLLKTDSLPKVSILEERLREPPKIEIPQTDITKVCESPTTPKDSLLIQKDAKMNMYQRTLDSPKFLDKGENKAETPRKDNEKHDFENVGSPRIILKIAKSAIAECGEPRSPKSPKIRSATNSPNPEDSPGQKLGKIKLKLSKGGHPSIISNENVEESSQWHSEGISSLSPIGMKIKLSKTGDASILPQEHSEESKEAKHKFEEIKRTESPIGMKIKLSKSGDASIVQQDSKDTITKHKEKLEMVQGSPKRTESPIGMKIKLSKTGDASIIQPEKQESLEERREPNVKAKEKSDTHDPPKRTDSPIGMKIKLSKTGDCSIVPSDETKELEEKRKQKQSEELKECSSRIKERQESSPEIPKRTESPIGMKIKLSKTKGGASIVCVENSEDKEKSDVSELPKRTDSPFGMKIKLSKTGDASIVHSEPDESKDSRKIQEKVELLPEKETKRSDSSGTKSKTRSAETVSSEISSEHENHPEILQKTESLGMKIKLSKTGDASIIPPEKTECEDEHRHKEIRPDVKRTESPIGMKIKLSKTGDASIIPNENISLLEENKVLRKSEVSDSTLGVKIKLSKTGDASIPESEKMEKKEKQQKRRDESPLEMKIKLSKTGHPTIIACDDHSENIHKTKEIQDTPHCFVNKYKETMLLKETVKATKSGHPALPGDRSEVTIEPIQNKKSEMLEMIAPKRKEVTISPIESKKSKLEAQLSQILPEVTIQPVSQKQLLFDTKSNLISRQQMNVISQEISITQVRPSKSNETSDKTKDVLKRPASPGNSDCEIIEHRPELIIVNENSNSSSQDVVIIEEVPAKSAEQKTPKKRGRPRRNAMVQLIQPPPQVLPRDPLALDEGPPPVLHIEQPEASTRPKRTCRNQKSYAPPKRGRRRGRGKRKLDAVDFLVSKKPRLEQDLTAIENSTMAVITLDESLTQEETKNTSECTSALYKALKQPAEKKGSKEKSPSQKQSGINTLEENSKKTDSSKSVLPETQNESCMIIEPIVKSNDNEKKLLQIENESEKEQKPTEKIAESVKTNSSDGKHILIPPGHSNWLTPTSKKQLDSSSRTDTSSTVQVIDEETRMSAESGSRSQTPARNIAAPVPETIVNEESQGSVLSTATTESEKVKVKNRRMEINFDPDEGPFTVDKIAEYEWPLDRKGETFMIQEQISQYLGVKSFKRKYPDLKRRVVDMEERNYLRENALVSEAMCDMGLTAICSSEVLDIMCSDFPDQYEEYRKHMREKQVKEHSKKQKELSAAANAEKNRIDLAEMAVQSALSWNVSLNKARRETRKYSLDLQTFTIHVPKKQQKIETERRVSHYPVALIPGQYTDYYREYTPAELRYYPLNTVLYGPTRPNERKFDSQSEGSQSDSDSDSSSDDSSSSSSEGTQDTEGSQSTMDDVDMDIVKDEGKTKCKMCLKTLNKHGKSEILIQCGTCNGHVHPTCIDLTLDMVPHIQSYAWQCTDCKICAQCHDPADEDKMLFCDMCDRGYHIYCVGLRRVPQGRWHCQECAVCANCGSREAGGPNSDRNSVAQWQHEYKKGEKNTRVYVSTLCVPCSKLWRKGRYCPHCSRCHTAQRLDLEENLVHCSACDKYLHLGCVETRGIMLDKKNYLCDFCAPNRTEGTRSASRSRT